MRLSAIDKCGRARKHDHQIHYFPKNVELEPVESCTMLFTANKYIFNCNVVDENFYGEDKGRGKIRKVIFEHCGKYYSNNTDNTMFDIGGGPEMFDTQLYIDLRA